MKYFEINKQGHLRNNEYLSSEQRRLFFLDLLSKDDTNNKVKEEAFKKLITDYSWIDFSGIQMTNLKEGINTQFNLTNCFRSPENIIIEGDTIYSVEFDNDKKCYNSKINLKNLRLGNTKFTYANITGVEKRRDLPNYAWLLIDDSEIPFFQQVIFYELYDTDFSHATLTSAIFEGGFLEKVSFYDALCPNVNFRNCRFYYCDFSGASFNGADLYNASLLNIKVNDKTNFMGVANYQNIKNASPFLIETIKKTFFMDKNISKWNYNWENINRDELPELYNKWVLWNSLKEKAPNSYIDLYKEKIKKFYQGKNGSDYDWEYEL